MKYSYLFLFVFILCSVKVTSNDSSQPPQIVELDKGNYKEVINSADSIMILFYDNACLKCRKFENAINEAIKRLIGESLSQDKNESEEAKQILSQMTFAKIDGYKNKEIVDEYEVENFPSVRFMRIKFNIKNELTQILDQNTISAGHIINFLKKRLNKKWIEVKSKEQLMEIIQQNNLNLVMCDDRREIYNETSVNMTINNITEHIDNMIVYYYDLTISHVSTKAEEIPENVNVNETAHQNLLDYIKCSKESPQIIIYKNYDEKEVRFFDLYNGANFNQSDVEDFMDTYTIPLVSEFNIDNLNLIIQRRVPALVYLYKDEVALESFGVFYSYSKKFRREILFLKLKSSEEHAATIMNMMGIREKDLPTIMAMQLNEEELLKHKMDDRVKITNGTLGKFIEGFRKRELKNHLLSESSNYQNPFYTDNDAYVHKVVGENFEKVVNNGGKCFLLYPYVGQVMPEIMQVIGKISRKLLEIDEDDGISIGIIDLEKNEVNSIEDPLILHLYNKNNTNTYDGTISVKKVISFLIDNHCYDKPVSISYTEEEQEEVNFDNPFDNLENIENYLGKSNVDIEGIQDQIKQVNANKKEDSAKDDEKVNPQPKADL